MFVGNKLPWRWPGVRRKLYVYCLAYCLQEQGFLSEKLCLFRRERQNFRGSLMPPIWINTNLGHDHMSRLRLRMYSSLQDSEQDASVAARRRQQQQHKVDVSLFPGENSPHNANAYNVTLSCLGDVFNVEQEGFLERHRAHPECNHAGGARRARRSS